MEFGFRSGDLGGGVEGLLTVAVYEKLGISEYVTVKPIQSLKRATKLDFYSIRTILCIPCYKLAFFIVKRYPFQVYNCFSLFVFGCRVECRQSFIYF